MSVRVRLTRVGSKKNPIWRVVVADQRSPRDGRFIETIGHYNPQTDPSTIRIDEVAGIGLVVASLLHACAHLEKFSTAATRRCLDRVSVPVWLVVLSDQLPVIALVSRYLTNQLIGRRPIGKR